MTVLSRSVVVLNRNWIPVGCIDVKKAISFLFSTNKNGDYKGGVIDLSNMSVHTVSSSWTLSCRGNSRLGESDSVDYVYSTKMKFRAPQAIILAEYSGVSAPERSSCAIIFDKRTIHTRDKFSCSYCGQRFKGGKSLTIDHIIPISRGGQSHFSNCVTACKDCNARKSDRTPEEAGMKLRITPRKPTLKQLNSLRREGYTQLWEDLLRKVGQPGENKEPAQYVNASET